MLKDRTTAQRLLYRMRLIRAFEEAVERLFTEGRIAGTAHPAIGQEATAVGVCAALTPNDRITSTHRGHGHLIAAGGDPRYMMAELFGKETGYSRGRGGSQMMACLEVGFLGANGITGGSLPMATGVALDAQLQGRERIAVCFFGDGAANQGTFHESLNLAALWKLPVLFVCENNGYAMSIPTQRSTVRTDLAQRAEPYGMPGISVDGNDLQAVHEATAAARSRALDGEGPTLLECRTYRLSGHSKGDSRAYRSRAEEHDAWTVEPVARFERLLHSVGHLDTATRDQLQSDAEAEITRAIEFAHSSPDPDPATVTEGVLA